MGDFDSVETATRRDFLLAGGVFAAGVIAAPAAARFQNQQNKFPQTRPATQPQSQPASQPSGSVPGVTPETFAEAEKLAGIEFTDAERQVMASSIAEQLANAQARLKQPYPPNDLAPALVFDPRLPGAKFSTKEQPIVRSRHDPGSLPNNDDDIAFAPVTTLSRWIEKRQLTSARL